MTLAKTAATASALCAPVWALVLCGSVAAQTVYVPPGAQRPRFGGEFTLTEVGPVAGYWPTACRVARIRAQSHRDGPMAPPAIKALFDRFVSGLIAQKPDYNDMSRDMADAVRKNLPTYWPSLNRMGTATVAKKVGANDAGGDIYVLDQAGGRSHWNILVNQRGQIEEAFICGGEGI